MSCDHNQFDADVTVMKVQDQNAYMAQLGVRCKQCGIPFQFQGLFNLPQPGQPHVSPNRVLAYLPIRPVEMRLSERVS